MIHCAPRARPSSIRVLEPPPMSVATGVDPAGALERQVRARLDDTDERCVRREVHHVLAAVGPADARNLVGKTGTEVVDVAVVVVLTLVVARDQLEREPFTNALLDVVAPLIRGGGVAVGEVTEREVSIGISASNLVEHTGGVGTGAVVASGGQVDLGAAAPGETATSAAAAQIPPSTTTVVHPRRCIDRPSRRLDEVLTMVGVHASARTNALARCQERW